MKVLILLLSLASLSAGEKNGGRQQLEEHYGYVDVRPGAHMFWVMYHVDQPGNHTDYPLIMWLQGGPGASGVGYGNFEELGPYHIDGTLREHAWTKKANVMFVDNPVGTGYSYVDSLPDLSTDNMMIATDLVELVKQVFSKHPDMQVMPFYVFAESYGGKMTVDFALEFDKAIKNGEVVSDFRGVGLGDSWIAPMDSVNTWGQFLYQMGFVNQFGLASINDAAASTQASVDAGDWSTATDKWSYTELVVMDHANNVNFYNVLAENDIYKSQHKRNTNSSNSTMSPELRSLYEHHVARQARDALYDHMNGNQADKWGIPDSVTWDGQSNFVFQYLSGDFMKPVVESVVKLLTETDLHVAVFTGNLDLICDTPGTYKWIEEMDWPDKPNFMNAKNEPIYISAYSSHAATIQRSGNFALYTILRSGHMVPIDAPEMSLKMLDMIFEVSKEKKLLNVLKHDETIVEVEPENPVKKQRKTIQNAPLKQENTKNIPEPVKVTRESKQGGAPKEGTKKETQTSKHKEEVAQEQQGEQRQETQKKEESKKKQKQLKKQDKSKVEKVSKKKSASQEESHNKENKNKKQKNQNQEAKKQKKEQNVAKQNKQKEENSKQKKGNKQQENKQKEARQRKQESQKQSKKVTKKGREYQYKQQQGRHSPGPFPNGN